ncbi:dihydrofolate reductase family protein [Pelagibacterium lentulum]|nr:dihydrofolate reductase family protein [Pelagibacterium lentulum]
MRKLTVAAFLSVDGIMQAPGGPDEDRDGGFAFGGWTAPLFDDTVGAAMGEMFTNPFDLLLGRRTFEIFANYWPKLEGKSDIADLFGSINKYVATRQAGYASDWRHTQILDGSDVIDAIRKLKQEDGRHLMTQGSANFIQTLLASDIVDELYTLTFPVVLGKGKRLFEGGAAPRALNLLHSTTSASGVTMNRYAYAGEVQTGSFSEE